MQRADSAISRAAPEGSAENRLGALLVAFGNKDANAVGKLLEGTAVQNKALARLLRKREKELGTTMLHRAIDVRDAKMVVRCEWTRDISGYVSQRRCTERSTSETPRRWCVVSGPGT